MCNTHNNHDSKTTTNNTIMAGNNCTIVTVTVRKEKMDIQIGLGSSTVTGTVSGEFGARGGEGADAGVIKSTLLYPPSMRCCVMGSVPSCACACTCTCADT